MISCRVDAHPAEGLVFTWVKKDDDGEEVPLNSEDKQDMGLSSKATIMVNDLEDYGVFLCRAKNAVGEMVHPCR